MWPSPPACTNRRASACPWQKPTQKKSMEVRNSLHVQPIIVVYIGKFSIVVNYIVVYPIKHYTRVVYYILYSSGIPIVKCVKSSNARWFQGVALHWGSQWHLTLIHEWPATHPFSNTVTYYNITIYNHQKQWIRSIDWPCLPINLQYTPLSLSFTPSLI